MQSVLLLIMIYIAFISLGLPDTVLGVAWPSMRGTLKLPLEAAGVLAMTTTLATAFSSFVSGHLLSKAGTGRVVFASCVMTGLALCGYSQAPSFFWLLACALPLGLGAGAVDTGLNNFVARNYSARHMSWLHCFWGIGASFGPALMNMTIGSGSGWQRGYLRLGLLQCGIAVLLGLSLPLWTRVKKTNAAEGGSHQVRTRGVSLLRQRGVFAAVMAFPLYVGIEAGTGLWLASYLLETKMAAQMEAGALVAVFYGSITAGRFAAGFLAAGISNRNHIRLGLGVMAGGMLLFNIPGGDFLVPGIVLLGLGCAPVFPSMIHETPRLFGHVNSEEITGYQVGMSYLGGVVLMPLLGFLAAKISMYMIPAFLALSLCGLFLITERLNRLLR